MPLAQYLEEIHYCINCVDATTERRGNFAYDVNLAERGLGLFAISPIFDTVDEFYSWAKGQGYIFHSTRHPFVMSKDFPK